MKILIATLSIAVLVGTASAQGGPQPGGGEEKFDIEAALKKVYKLMREAEKSLTESLDSEKSAEDAAEAGRKAKEEIDKLLGSGREKGKEIVDTINEILENLPQQQGGGGGGHGQMPEPEDEKKQQKQDGKQVGDRDPRNSRDGEPESPDKQPTTDETEKTKKPPPSEAKEKVEVDPTQEWLARLPPQVRQDLLNGDLDKVPEKWKPLIEAWFKKMAEIEDD
jgi:hypothetical protein